MKDEDSAGKPTPKDHSALEGFPDAANSDQRPDPVFTDFDDDADYEESDRDIDYASAYEEEVVAEDERGDSPNERDSDNASDSWQVLGGVTPMSGSARDAGDTARDATAATEAQDQDPDIGIEAARMTTDPDMFEDEDYPRSEDESTDWEDHEDYPDDPDQIASAPEEEKSGWPIGLILVGLVALALLAAGGYGVIQQRAADQEEIRQLRSALATAASPAEVAATRESLRELEQQNEDHLANIEVLELYNKRLTDTVAGLETQLAAQQAEAPRVEEPIQSAPADPIPEPAAPQAVSAAAQTTPDTASPGTTGTGEWFVNFSSYSQRSAAEKWLGKINPETGKAVITAVDIDGQTLYRLRIVGLADRAQAEKVARKLQSDHELPPLWVGRE